MIEKQERVILKGESLALRFLVTAQLYIGWAQRLYTWSNNVGSSSQKKKDNCSVNSFVYFEVDLDVGS